MSNIGKETLTPDTQLSFTCFLRNIFLTADSYIRNQRSISLYRWFNNIAFNAGKHVDK